MREQPCTAAAEKPMLVRESLSRLEDRLTAIGDELDRLERDLDVILLPQMPPSPPTSKTTSGPIPAASSVPLSSRTDNMVSKADGLIDHLRIVIDRIRL